MVPEFFLKFENHLGFVWQNKKNILVKKIVKNSWRHVCQTCSKDKKKWIFFFVEFFSTKHCHRLATDSA